MPSCQWMLLSFCHSLCLSSSISLHKVLLDFCLNSEDHVATKIELIQSVDVKWFPVSSFIYWNVHLYMRYRLDQWLQIAKEITWDQPRKRQVYLSTCAESNPHQAQWVVRTNKWTPWWFGVYIPGWYPALWKCTIVLFINLLRSCVWPSRICLIMHL